MKTMALTTIPSTSKLVPLRCISIWLCWGLFCKKGGVYCIHTLLTYGMEGLYYRPHDSLTPPAMSLYYFIKQTCTSADRDSFLTECLPTMQKMSFLNTVLFFSKMLALCMAFCENESIMSFYYLSVPSNSRQIRA